MPITIKKGLSIILQDKSKIVSGGKILHGGFLNLLLPVLATVGGPVLANILNKIVDAVDVDDVHKHLLIKIILLFIIETFIIRII